MNYLSKLFFSFCFIAGLGMATVSRAQIPSDLTIQANIPYTFVVGDKQLPPGKYTIKVAGVNDLKLMQIRGEESLTTVFFSTEHAEANDTPSRSELVFDKIGDTYFLSQIWLKGYRSGSQITESKRQQELESRGLTTEKRSVAGEVGRAIKRTTKVLLPR